MMPRGYERPLYILPFDHRESFQGKLFGWKPPLSGTQTAAISAAKQIVYDGLQEALTAGVPPEHAGILVDEQFGGVGRTDFWDPLVAWRDGAATRERIVAEIAARHRGFVNLFEGIGARSSSDAAPNSSVEG